MEEEKVEEEEVGRQEALARDTRTRHTINTIFALPLSPYPTPRVQPHPSIYPSMPRCRGDGGEREAAVVLALLLSLSRCTARVRFRT